MAYSRMIQIRVSEGEHRDWHGIAREAGVNLSDYIRRAITLARVGYPTPTRPAIGRGALQKQGGKRR